MANPALTKDQLLSFKPRKVEFEDGDAFIRPLRAAYAISLRGRDLVDESVFEMLAQAICDASGELILTAEEVGNLPLPRLTRILEAVKELNAISETKAADNLKKTLP